MQICRTFGKGTWIMVVEVKRQRNNECEGFEIISSTSHCTFIVQLEILRSQLSQLHSCSCPCESAALEALVGVIGVADP